MSRPTSKPAALILVPGGFCPGDYFHKVTDVLTSKGHTIAKSTSPPSANASTAPASTADDAAHVRYHATELLKAGHNVVLVGNSYGGFIITEAAKGLSKTDRNADSTGGEIVHLVYIASLLAPVGMNVHELVGAEIPVSTESNAEYIPAIPAEAAGAILFSKPPAEEQVKYGAMQRRQSALAMTGRLTYAADEEYPTTVVVPLRDKALSTEFQLKKFEEVRNNGVCKRGLRKVEVDADHCCMVSRAEEIADLLVEAAEGKV